MNHTHRAHVTARHRAWPNLCAALLLTLAVSSGVVVEQTRTVRVGVYQNEPKIFMDQKGQASGLFIELLDQIAAQEGWVLAYVACEWEACLRALEDGQLDLMPDVAYSTERAAKYDFHQTPVLESWSRVYASPNTPITKISELDGKRIAVLKGSIQQTVFQQLMVGFGYKAILIPVDSFEQAFAQVADGSADAAITNHLFGDYFYQKQGLLKTTIDFNPVALYYATAEGRNPDLLAAIDRYLGQWIPEPGSPYYTTLGHWSEKEPVYRIPQYVFWVIGGGLGLLVLAAGMIALLRRQVRVRTKYLVQANAELHESEQRYQTLARISPVGIFRTGSDGATTYVNPKWCAIAGLSVDQALGDGWLEAVHPADKEKLSRGWQASTRLHQTSFSDYRFVRPDGTLAWVMGQAVPEMNAEQQVIGYVGTITDITERKQAEARVLRLNQLYATLSQLNQAIVHATDRDTLFRETCRVAIEYGQFRLAWIGLIDETDQRVKPVAMAGEEQDYLANVSIAYQDEELGRGPTGTAIREGHCVLCQDMDTDPRMGPWRAAAVRRGFRSSAAVPIRQADRAIGALSVYAGEPHQFDAEEEALLVEIGQTISYALDGLIHESQRQQAEAKLRQLNLELEQRVAQRTAQLNSANEQLRARNDELKAFAYTVSHDLKAPLRGISGYAQELDRRHRANLSDRAQFCLTQIMTATRNLDHLIEDLLHYSRLDTETPTHTHVDLRELIDTILRDRARLIAEQGTQVEIDLAADGTSAWERGLLQALTNLIDNALKYSRKSQPPRVVIHGERLAQGYRVSVADNGVGFDMKYHDRIFGLFNRLVRADEFEGTGAGLAIARKAIEKQGGKLWAEAQPGAGATFFIELSDQVAQS